MVMTIDPARRLADALGMQALGGHGTTVAAAGIPAGTLDAMMLDQKGAWDELVERHAVLADLYGPGADLDRDAASLRKLGVPAYVLYRPGAQAPAAVRPDLFEPAYDGDGYVVYRVRVP